MDFTEDDSSNIDAMLVIKRNKTCVKLKKKKNCYVYISFLKTYGTFKQSSSITAAAKAMCIQKLFMLLC